MEDSLRVGYEGFRPGMYVRVELDRLPCELINNFDATYPLILGGQQSVEGNIGYVQVKMIFFKFFIFIVTKMKTLIMSLSLPLFCSTILLNLFFKLEL